MRRECRFGKRGPGSEKEPQGSAARRGVSIARGAGLRKEAGLDAAPSGAPFPFHA